MTMLGTTRSGKSTYLLGMYAILSAGLNNYFVRTEDPDQDLDLSDAWDLLCDNGELPPPTTSGDYRNYGFVFSHQLTSLISIDCADYRGGALADRAENNEDVGLLHQRLEASDSIYLVLDGERIGDWLAGDLSDHDVQRKLKIARMTQHVQRAVEARQARGLPAPSIVLLITKADVVKEKNGSLGPALRRAAENLERLVPVAYQQGVTALICPVQLGRFGSGNHEQIDTALIDPVGVHRPLIFTLMHFLTEGIEAHQDELRELKAQRDAATAEALRLRTGFMNGLFRRGAIRRNEDDARDYEADWNRVGRDLGARGDRIAQLAAELKGQYIVVDGKVTR